MTNEEYEENEIQVFLQLSEAERLRTNKPFVDDMGVFRRITMFAEYNDIIAHKKVE